MIVSKRLGSLVLTAFMALTLAGAGCKKKGSSQGDYGPDCEKEFDKAKFSDKYIQCKACEKQHRGMGSMEPDCKKAIAKPWK